MRLSRMGGIIIAQTAAAAAMSSTVLSFKDFSVRPRRPCDRSAAVEVFRTCMEEYGFYLDLEGFDRDILQVEECYQDGELWEKIVGTAGYYKIEEEAVEIRKLYLLREARGKGLGRSLLQVSGRLLGTSL